MRDIVDKAVHGRRPAIDDPVRPLRNRLEHRLHIVGRAGDHLQDIGRCGLPLQRLLRLVEQPHVLDGDHGLIGKGLQQFDVMWGKRAGGLPAYRDRSN